MTILDKAAEITSKDRNQTYGPPRENIQQTVELINAYLKKKLKTPLTSRDFCWLMILLKASRDSHLPKEDNLVDTAGWARVAEMLGETKLVSTRTSSSGSPGSPPQDQSHPPEPR